MMRTTTRTSFFDSTTNLGWMHSWQSEGVDFDNDNNNDYNNNDYNDDYDNNHNDEYDDNIEED